jgi:hypothetical protein
MVGRKIILIAVVLYAAVVGCVVSSSTRPESSTVGAADSPTSATQPVTGLVHIDNQRPFCGVAIQLQRVDWVPEYEQLIDQIAADGADTVSLVVDARQENAESTRMYVDMRMTMTVPQLSEIIAHAKSRGLRVILMPIVLLAIGMNGSTITGR